jgi:hypothetical protein
MSESFIKHIFDMTKKAEASSFKRIVRGAMREEIRQAGHKRRVQRDNRRIQSIVRDLIQKIISIFFKK